MHQKLRPYPDEGPVRQERNNEVFLKWALDYARENGIPEERAHAALEQAKTLRAIGVYQRAEAVLTPSGTIISVNTADGIQPGLSLEQLFQAESDVYYQYDSGGEVPKTYVAAEGTEFDFGKSLDSSDCRMSHLATIATNIASFLEDHEINRMVVLWGTDTKAYALAALAQMIRFPTAKIVVTSAMKPVGEEGSDAGPNINRSRLLADCQAEDDPCITASFGDKVLDPRRISKVHSSDQNAFESLGSSDIARHIVSRDGRWELERIVPTIRDCVDFLLKFTELAEIKQKATQTNELIMIKVREEDPGRFVNRISLEELREIALDMFPVVKSYLKRGGALNVDDLLCKRFLTVDTSYENSAIWEGLYPGYKAEWLEALLEDEEVHGVMLSGIETLDPETHKAIVEVISKYADKKAIILMQDPEEDETTAEKALQFEAMAAGAILSKRYTIEWSTILLKRLLAKTHNPEEIRELWEKGDQIGVPAPIPNYKDRSEEDLRPRVRSLNNNIRVININFDHPPELLEGALMREDVDGVVLKGFGPGNLPEYLVEVMRRVSAVKPCVMATQIEGPQNTDYEAGRRIEELGMLQAGDLPWYAAAEKLDRLISKAEGYSEIKKLW